VRDERLNLSPGRGGARYDAADDESPIAAEALAHEPPGAVSTPKWSCPTHGLLDEPFIDDGVPRCGWITCDERVTSTQPEPKPKERPMPPPKVALKDLDAKTRERIAPHLVAAGPPATVGECVRRFIAASKASEIPAADVKLAARAAFPGMDPSDADNSAGQALGFEERAGRLKRLRRGVYARPGVAVAESAPAERIAETSVPESRAAEVPARPSSVVAKQEKPASASAPVEVPTTGSPLDRARSELLARRARIDAALAALDTVERELAGAA